MSELERIFKIRPAYDCIGVQPCVHGSEACKPGTGGSHGRHNAELHMTVRGPEAEITLIVGTGWDLPTVPEYYRHSGPKAMLVEIHTARPRYEGQESYRTPQPGDSCEHWSGCYVDQGYRLADEPTALLVEKGSDAAWEWLENLYNETRMDMAEAASAPYWSLGTTPNEPRGLNERTETTSRVEAVPSPRGHSPDR